MQLEYVRIKNRGAKLDKSLYILNSSKYISVLIESFFVIIKMIMSKQGNLDMKAWRRYIK